MFMKHNKYIDYLIDNLYEIDERPEDVEWIMKEGIWLKKYSTSRYKMCDLILFYYPEFERITLIEVKSNRKKRDKAKIQLDSSERFVRNVLKRYEPITKKIAYINGKYDIERD